MAGPNSRQYIPSMLGISANRTSIPRCSAKSYTQMASSNEKPALLRIRSAAAIECLAIVFPIHRLQRAVRSFKEIG